MNKNRNLVLVEWLDSPGCTHTWQELTDYKSVLPVMKSIGWIVYENKELVSLCSNLADETDNTLPQGNGIMTIPKKCITKRKLIKV